MRVLEKSLMIGYETEMVVSAGLALKEIRSGYEKDEGSVII